MGHLRLRGLRPHGLAPLDLDIAPGEMVLLSGPSGAGKSVLLRAIADLDPHPGEAWLDQHARATLAPAVWRRRVALLPAEPAWWAETVGAHFPPAFGGDAQGLDWLRQLGFEPHVLDWNVARLSTGERQRLALARLLAHRPEVLLLDEPTANLDPDSRARVETLIAAYRDRRPAAVFWVSHDPAQRRRLGGRGFVIAAGRLVPEDDAPAAPEFSR